jgi:hypothetical protein
MDTDSIQMKVPTPTKRLVAVDEDKYIERLRADKRKTFHPDDLENPYFESRRLHGEAVLIRGRWPRPGLLTPGSWDISIVSLDSSDGPAS